MFGSERFQFYFKKFFLYFNLLTILLSVIGSYQYWQPRVENEWMLLSATLFTSLRLYLFQPQASPGEFVSWTYELAKWMAPFVTSVAMFSLLSSWMRGAYNSFRYRFGEKMVVFGENLNLLQQVSKSKAHRFTLFVDRAINQNQQKDYLKMGFVVRNADLTKANDLELKDVFRSIRLPKVKALILSHENDFKNFQLASLLFEHLHPDREVNLAISMESDELIRSLTKLKQSHQNPDLKWLNLKFFNESTLVGRSIFNQLAYPLYTNVVKELTPSLSSVEAIDAAMDEIHFLIVGFNRLSSKLLTDIASLGTMTLSRKTKITILDQQATKKLDFYKANHHQMDKALDLVAIDVDIFSTQCTEIINNLSSLDYVFINFRDVHLNLRVLDLVGRKYRDIPIAIRNVSNYDLSSLLKTTPNPMVFDYGQLNQIYGLDNILFDGLDDHTKRFNKNYARTSNHFMRSQSSDWKDLTELKKDSSRASYAHGSFKKAVYEAILPDHSPARYQAEIAELYKKTSNHDQFNTFLIEFLEKYPAIDFLTRLEHKRWNNFHYARNYQYGETRDDDQLKHPALIDDWDVVLKEKYRITYPIFDLITIFAALENEDE